MIKITKKEVIQVHHEISDDKWTFQDTKIYEKDQLPTDEELETEYQNGFTKWKEYCETPIQSVVTKK